MQFCKENEFDVVKTYQEQKSAFKTDVNRLEWNNLVELAIEERYDIILFRYDRSFRNRKEFVKFMREMHLLYKIKVYSVSENWLNQMWNGISKMPELPEPFNKIINMFMELIWNILIELIGEQAEEDSRKKGLSVKNAVRRKPGKPTKSYKGNKWGRKGISKQAVDKIIKLRYEGLTIREIAQNVQVVDKNKNMKNISTGLVHKILHQNPQEKSSNLGSS